MSGLHTDTDTDTEGAGAAAVAAVVVNYEAGGTLADCVESLRAAGIAELAVVDNGSTDGSIAQLRRRCADVDVVTPGANLGYGAGANRGVAATGSRYVLICNPDLALAAGAVSALAEALDADPSAGLAGPLIRTRDGDRYPSARRFPSLVDSAGHALLGMFYPTNPFTRAYQRPDLTSYGAGALPVDWVSGACLLARREAIEQVGGFDEAYFMYVEDVDLCWRIGKAGWKVLYVPEAEVTHLQGVSTARRPYRMIFEHHRSLVRFARRSTAGWRRLVLPLVIAGIAVRAVLAYARILAA